MADTYMQVKCEWKIERELYENIGFSSTIHTHNWVVYMI